jgi:hypothetical protein
MLKEDPTTQRKHKTIYEIINKRTEKKKTQRKRE